MPRINTLCRRNAHQGPAEGLGLAAVVWRVGWSGPGRVGGGGFRRRVGRGRRPDRAGPGGFPSAVEAAVAELATVGLVEGLHLALVGVGRAGGAPPIREGPPPSARRGAPGHRAG